MSHSVVRIPSNSPADVLVIVGAGLAWSEAVGRRAAGPARVGCPNMCEYRDLEWERRRGLRLICLRCLLYSYDDPTWTLPIPLSRRRAREAWRRERAEVLSLAQRKFAGRERKRLGRGKVAAARPEELAY